MITTGIKYCLKSFSLGSLNMIDETVANGCDSPGHISYDKHNISTSNEQVRNLYSKLKEFEITGSPNSICHESEAKKIFLPTLPENNLKQLQANATKEIYQQQSAIWELLVTEQNFLKQIQFIVQVYVLGFEILRNEFFPKITSEEIFSNLKEVSRVSLKFWRQCMQPVVDNYETTKSLLKPNLLKNGFIKIGEILQPYSLYCTEISKCRLSISSLEKSSELFAEYMKWAMNLEKSNREMLGDHLAKPFLRLTKYKILLQAIQKYSDDTEKSNIQEMINSVDAFVSLVNEKIEETCLKNKLYYLSSHIDSYNVIEPLGDDLIPIIKQFSKFDLTTPIEIGNYKLIRQLIKQGAVKMRDGSSKTMDIKLFLFTDILLVTKYKKKTLGKLKIIRSPIVLDTVLVKKQSHSSFVCICLNKFKCISSLYHFTDGNQKKADEWIQSIEDAIMYYRGLQQNQIEKSVYKDHIEIMPTLKIEQSSPKVTSRFKSQSNSESLELESRAEFNFKRKAPVTKKHKNKKEPVSVKEKPASIDVIPRKTSNSIIKMHSASFMDRNTKISKSNSFAENEKTKALFHYGECSDVDEPCVIRSDIKNPSQNIKMSSDLVKVTDSRNTGIAKRSYLKRNQSQLSPKSDNSLDRKHSISLNELNT